jgi:hypothetical protein
MHWSDAKSNLINNQVNLFRGMKFLSQKASHDLLKNVEAWVHLVSQTHVRQGQVHAWVHLVSQTQGRECQVHARVGTSCLLNPRERMPSPCTGRYILSIKTPGKRPCACLGPTCLLNPTQKKAHPQRTL